MEVIGVIKTAEVESLQGRERSGGSCIQLSIAQEQLKMEAKAVWGVYQGRRISSSRGNWVSRRESGRLKSR
jgi:hypothetical protein